MTVAIRYSVMSLEKAWKEWRAKEAVLMAGYVVSRGLYLN